ncbi:hypothetical protein [Streptomyces sp. NPDC058595]|uniref:hypothetical protein n=1 Tax=Streptomyces sp. NPDC058595 TaxID=3346550 RepID=UPI003667D56B
MTTSRRARPSHVSAAAIAITVALGVALLLVLTGCSDSEEPAEQSTTPAADSAPPKDTAPEADSDLAPAGKALATVAGDEDMVARVTKVERTSKYLTVTAVLENTGPEDFLATGWKDETGRTPYTLAGSSFVDEANGMRYLPVLDEKGICECTFQLGGKLKAGQSTTAYIRFPGVPADVTTVDLKIATFPPVELPLPEGE